MTRRAFIFTLLLIVHTVPVYAGGNEVVVSIKPLHSLVATVMQGTGEQPLLLVDGKASPHAYALKPSQVAALQKAKLVFYVSDNFELFLRGVWPSLPKSVSRLPMDKTDNLTLYDVRSGKNFMSDGDKDEHTSGRDMHYWLFSENAKTLVMEIARQLAIAFPKNREIYFDNVRRFSERMELLHGDLDGRMVALRGKPFIVFHDAYQYFENDYGIHAAGVIARHPEQGLSAKHVQEIRALITSVKAACVFREPSFDGKVVNNIAEGTGAKSGVLDPEGALLQPGPELYFQLLNGIAAGLEQCLGNKS